MRLLTRRSAIITTVVLALTMSLQTVSAADPPPNDSFLTAKSVTLPFDETVDISSATAEVVDSTLCSSGKTVWYSVTLAAGESMMIDATQTSFPTTIAIFNRGVPIGGSCSTTQLRTFRASTAGTYAVRIGTNELTVTTPLIFGLYTPGTISGRVVNDAGLPLSSIEVSLYKAGRNYYTGWSYTDDDGSYSISNLPRGSYELRFRDWNRLHIHSWYRDSWERSGARTVDVVHGPVTLLDQTLNLGGTITGSVTLSDGSVPPRGCLELYSLNGTWAGYGYIDEDGSFEINGLRGGGYKLNVTECSWTPLGIFEAKWYQDAPDFASASIISVTLGQQVSGIDVVVAGSPVPSNDDISNAITIDALPVTLHQGLTRATTAASDPLSCGIVGRTAWYTFTTTEKELLFLNFSGSHAAVGVHAVAADGSLSNVGCGSKRWWESAQIQLEGGRTYMIEVGSTSSTEPSGASLSLFDSDGGGTLRFSPSEPCHVRCPYWNQERTNEQKYEDACAPTPASNEGSWDDHRIDVPATINGKVPYALGFTMDPKVDHDVWFCRVEPDANGKYLVTYSANPTTKPCDHGVPLVGCSETFQASVEPGKSYIIRVYNWSDPEPVDGSYWFLANKAKTATATPG